jgi:citrate lyase beta subunit
MMDEYAPDAAALAGAVGISDAVASDVHARVRARLERAPVEDFRIDFEDGSGNRPDVEEDGHAASAAAEVADGHARGTLPPHIGIRIKPLTEELRDRSLRTLDIFLTELTARTGGALPPNFVITLPKITVADHVAAFADILAPLETALGLPDRSLVFEVMVELPQIIAGAGDSLPLTRIVEAGGGRITGAHFGTYDYTAASDITAAHQRMGRSACTVAKEMMRIAFAGTGVFLSDGATAILPVPPHRAGDGELLTDEQMEQNRVTVHRAWKLHYDDVRASLEAGFYQGWDLHPAQLVTRYAALYAFFLEGLDAAADRLRNFIARAAQATLIGDTFDDAATGQGLLNYFIRAVNAGAVTEEEAVERSGLTLDELRTRSFVEILRRRR